jgi:glycosyltransferase A (GT-A) superfamily protein (DUF2064 family)
MPTSSPWARISASTDPAALVVRSLAAPADPALDDALGAAGAAALRALLADRALDWAAAHAPTLHAAVADATAAVAALDTHSGPVLLVAPDVPGLGDRLAEAALADLVDGAQLAMAPATDGRPFLVALARADPDLVRAAADGLPDRQAAAELIDGELGLLRSERRLVTPGDARAFAADPLTPPALAALLR